VGQSLVETFTVTVTDDNNATATQDVTVTINGTNDAPVAEDDSFSVDKGATVNGNVISHEDSKNGIKDGISDTDGGDGVTLSVIQITVGNVNYAVTSSADTVVALGDGTLTIDSKGAFSYAHNGNELEGDVPSFEYILSDAGAQNSGSNPATVTIDINDLPEAIDDTLNTFEGTTSIPFNVMNNDTGLSDNLTTVTHVNGIELDFEDANSDYATLTMIDGNIDAVASGNIGGVTFDGATDNGILRIKADGTFTYENKGFLEGSDAPKFLYTLEDGNGDVSVAEVTIKVNTNAPEAKSDANVISLKEAYDSGTAFKASVEGNVVIGGATSDGESSDTSLDGFGLPIVTQVVFGNTTHTFTTGTPLEIDTNYGTLTIHDTGDYKFSTGVFMDIPGGVESLVFTYTIQDGDSVNPDTDSADLMINIISPDAQGLKAQEPSAKFIELDLDETSGSIDTFSHTPEKTDFDEGIQGFIQDIQLDLSDVLAQTHSDSLDEYLDPGADSQKVAFNPDLDLETGKGAPMEQDLVLDKAGTESEESAGVYVTNGLLAQGGMIISDAFAANPLPLPEFDTQDVL
jgi:hypothetical protein